MLHLNHISRRGFRFSMALRCYECHTSESSIAAQRRQPALHPEGPSHVKSRVCEDSA